MACTADRGIGPFSMEETVLASRAILFFVAALIAVRCLYAKQNEVAIGFEVFFVICMLILCWNLLYFHKKIKKLLKILLHLQKLATSVSKSMSFKRKMIQEMSNSL